MMMRKMIAGAALLATLVGTTSPALANTTAETATQTQAQTQAQTQPQTATTEAQTTTQAEAQATTTATATAEAELPAAGLTPDQLFYFVKLWIEKVQVVLTRDAAERATLLEKQAQTRLAEAMEMAQAGKVDLAQKAMVEAQLKLQEASTQIKIAAETGKDLTGLVKLVEKDQTRFAKVVTQIMAELPAEAHAELQPVTTELLVQVAAAQDAAKRNEEAIKEAKKAAAEAGLEAKLEGMQPRTVLVLKAMAEASDKDLADVLAMYQKNPGLGRIAKELGLKMGPVQHAAQIEWKKEKGGEIKLEVEVEAEAKEEAKVKAEKKDGSLSTAVGNVLKLNKVNQSSDDDQDDEDEDDEKESKGKGKSKSKSKSKDEKK